MRKLFHVFLSLMIVYASTTSAFAASPAGWTASAADTVMAGATATITAFKGSGSNAMKAVITHKPTAVAVGKEVIKVGGALAVIYAINELLGAGVDWVLDPANNTVKYTVPNDVIDPDDGKYAYSYNGVTYYNSSDYCAAYGSANNVVGIKGRTVPYNKGFAFQCYTSRGNSITQPVSANPNYQAPPATVDKTIPISAVADKIIANAEAGHVDSQDFIKSVAVGQANTGELDVGLEAVSEPTTDTPTDTPTDPTKPFDPIGIITAINALKALLASIIQGISDLTGFFNSDLPPENPSQDVPIDVVPPTSGASDFDVNYVNFGGQCPVLPSYSINIMGVSVSDSFNMTPLCNLAVAIRPAIIAMAYFFGLGIIASSIRGT